MYSFQCFNIIIIVSVIYCNAYESFLGPTNYNEEYFASRLNKMPQLFTSRTNQYSSDIWKKSSNQAKSGTSLSGQQCFDNIYRNCLVKSSYTEQDVENVRLYLQQRFAKTNPVRPVCQKLRVRRDLKCMAPKEVDRFLRVIKQLFDNGVMDKLSLIHGTWWPNVHKFVEGMPWHRWHINVLQQEMLKIDPSVTIPYWEFISEFAAPEKSSIWNDWGRAGNKDNDFCVTDGAFANQPLKYPTPHCLRREWNPNGTIPVWEPPEWMTSTMQTTTNNWPLFAQLVAFVAHFKTHLYVGGFAGDMAIPYATNDPLFYPFHVHHSDYVILKWQLSEDINLVPQSYNLGFRWDVNQNRMVSANINADALSYYTDVSVKETWQVGYGQLCYIHDQLIQPINDIIRNYKLTLPPAVARLRQALPSRLFSSYYPKFASNNATFFDYVLPDVGDCPPIDKCQPLPISLPYLATATGVRQINLFRYALGFDLSPQVFAAEYQYYEFMKYVNDYQYCSPYNIVPQNGDYC